MSLLTSRLGRTAALLVAMGAVAHAAGDGSMTVTVTTKSGAPLAGAKVIASSPTQIGGARTAVTDAAGRARFPRLTTGTFTVQISADGYQAQTVSGVEILVDQNQAVSAKLVEVGSANVEVVAALPSVDTTTVTSGVQLTQDDIQSLPVARTQLATLALAPGVISTGGPNGGNPALTTGLDRDNFGNQGARNNTYMVDGMDMTSPESGLYSTSVPQELVANQDVKTGGITAEYSAKAGLFSNVTTISGSNEWHGGITVSLQDSSWPANIRPGRVQVANYDLTDLAVWADGPIIKDKLWIVASAQGVKLKAPKIQVADASTLTPGEVREGVGNDEKRYFAKLTYAFLPGHTLTAEFMRNPGHYDNLTDPTIVTARGIKTETGGSNYLLAYSWQTPSFILDVKAGRHEEALTQSALYSNLGPQVDMNTDPAGGVIPVIQRTFGNSGAGTGREYRRDMIRVDGTFLFDAMGSHALKAGLQSGKDQLTQTIFISGGAQYNTLGGVGSVTGAGPTFGYVDANYSGNVPGTASRLLSAINNQAAYASVKTALDTNSDGTVDNTELDAYQFNELFDAGNPNEGYQGYRITLDSKASSTPKMEFRGGYIQDKWNIGRFTISPGFRLDQYNFKADNGQSLFKTSYQFAPRVGVIWDVEGDGRTKASAYFGRYIDPIKLDMVRFTGSLTSSVRLEQIRIANTWVTENTRGGSKTVDAVFADTFKLPKTDEVRFDVAHDFGNGWSLDGTYTYRKDYDIVEDWDPTLYTDPNNLEAEARSIFGIGGTVGVYTGLTSAQKHAIDVFRGLALSPDYFSGGGYSGAQNIARIYAGQLNFVLANLPDAARYYSAFDVTVAKKATDHWGGLFTYSLIHATGDSLSSGDADFQGDLGRFDPRLGYMNGTLDGSIDWQAKMFVYYKWDMGLQLGVTASANSGYHYSDSKLLSRRVLLAWPTDPAAVDTNLMGKNRTPQTNQIDVHAEYSHALYGQVKGSVFLDVFNFLNSQQATNLAEGTNIRGTYAANQPYAYQLPRHIQLGFRVTF
ncbi:MAG TPA: carboxypeptidase regulatory-like domain-containing protein [Holophagaceae bacterium]|nr:carboxypeptidase regulatory-like domain-containing protein [Holophagaceae bacterium]